MGWITPLTEQKTSPRDVELAELAARQRGLVTRSQLAELGVRDGAIAARVRAGRLHRIHRGVYAVGHPGLTFEARCLAATLAGGPEAALSHRAATALWGLLPPSPEPFDVTTTQRGRQGAKGIVLHRSRHPPEATTHQGIRVTTIPRTLLDLAATTARHDLERAIREAQAQRLVTRDILLAFMDRSPGRPGVPALSKAVGGGEVTRSALERSFLALIDHAGIARPEVNVRVAGLEVDFLWRHERLVVETDGFAAHATHHGFERDREREAVLARAGLRMQRFSWRQVTERPREVTNTLLALVKSAG